MQEKLYPVMDHPCAILHKMIQLIQGAQILSVPIFVTEQYPKGLGQTIPEIQNLLKPHYQPFEKTTFSALGADTLAEQLPDQVVVAGIEAHVCVLQTVKDLLKRGKEAIVLNDAISSRSVVDFSTAIAEMRDLKVRITSTETLLFEWLGNATHPQFRSISQLVKA
ncbi:MAG: isochorismatase family protein [Chlamydiia bacterium]|nr:isochorismatase family protein [Chlamydiia bacterium]